MQAQIWKSLWVENSTSLLYLPILSLAKTWKILTNMLWQFFSTKADIILSENNLYFGEHLFSKTAELIMCSRLRVQDFATGKNFLYKSVP